MLKEHWRLISRIERAGDFLIAFFAFFAAYYGRESLYYWNVRFQLGLPFEGPELAPLKDYFIVLVLALLGYGVALQVMGAYGRMRLSGSWELLRLFAVASGLVFVLLAAAMFLLKIDLSRSFIGLFCLLSALLLTAERYFILWLLRYYRRRGFNYRNVAICGVGLQALKLVREIVSRPELGIHIRVFADLRPGDEVDAREVDNFRRDLKAAGCAQSGRILRGGAALEKALREYAIDEVIFTDIAAVMPQVEEMVLICSEQGVRTTLAADLFSLGMVKSAISYFGGMPLIHFQTPPGDRWELAVKRAMDVVLSLIHI